MQDLKKEFWKKWRAAVIGKVPYIVAAYFFYPFIKRTKTREKFFSGKGGWWNRQLWLMLNDDELHRYTVDYDVRKVKDAGIDTSTKWGRFKASWWFNVWRNPAYNYSLTNAPIKPTEYLVPKDGLVKDDLTKNGNYISPLMWAKWAWRNNSGQIDNRGKKVAPEHSIIGDGEVWFHPNNRKDLLYCRKSFAHKHKFLWWTIYEWFQVGAWSDKYDIIYKVKFRKN